LSQGRKQVVIDLLVSTALRTFDKQEHREYWIALIGAESGFDGNAKSPVGAVGLGQLLPQYRETFGKQCGLDAVDANDVKDDAVNAALSACFFKSLIEQTGSVPMALVGYNSGMNSQALKSAKIGAAMNTETANHLSKIWISREGR
jgi:soluble lytic murein transglycosylase-like protein